MWGDGDRAGEEREIEWCGLEIDREKKREGKTGRRAGGREKDETERESVWGSKMIASGRPKERQQKKKRERGRTGGRARSGKGKRETMTRDGGTTKPSVLAPGKQKCALGRETTGERAGGREREKKRQRVGRSAATERENEKTIERQRGTESQGRWGLASPFPRFLSRERQRMSGERERSGARPGLLVTERDSGGEKPGWTRPFIPPIRSTAPPSRIHSLHCAFIAGPCRSIAPSFLLPERGKRENAHFFSNNKDPPGHGIY